MARALALTSMFTDAAVDLFGGSSSSSESEDVPLKYSAVTTPQSAGGCVPDARWREGLVPPRRTRREPIKPGERRGERLKARPAGPVIEKSLGLMSV